MTILTLLLAICLLASETSAAGQDWRHDSFHRRHGTRLSVGRSYLLPAGESAAGPVVVIGGSATIDGRVDDDVVVVGGDVRVGPAGRVGGDIVAVLGEVQVADSGMVYGDVHHAAVFWPDIHIWPLRWGIDRVWWALFGLAGTLFRLALVAIVAILITAAAPGWIGGIGQRSARAPLASGAIGGIVEILLVPAVIISVIGLVLSIVGIPLLLAVPFALAAFALFWTAGFAAVASQLGARLRAPGAPASGATIGNLLRGMALIASFTVAGHLLAFGPGILAPLAGAFGTAGLLVEYLAWTVGLGAALGAPLGNRSPGPPPVPQGVEGS